MKNPFGLVPRVAMLGILAGAGMAVAPGPASAQQMPINTMGGAPSFPSSEAPTTKALPPPEALPGAKSTGAPAAASHIPTDMSPTDALFDAINRGDAGAARDALNRGADLNGKNVLGMTPMELSIDLGRNDISFLLLSMRGEAASSTPPATGTPLPVQATKPAPPPRGRGAVKTVAAVQAPAAPATPRLFAGDGGAPNPQVGFLGFDPASVRQ
jgi:hypothetical protein